ncbi:hypothetical protein SAMN05216266_110142 [Amycolatopsis marina]|uniref:ABC transporter n=1 Tax=Amycolatopsis marina TaxID=490629 RepID=A0A1I1AUD5_9PSEU|nr:hypothetical protein [Amycolatopsis marina]SFB41142.1 hypothetical protein SAMN05216266_110142 [Amycolatopsis marina]
MRFPKDSTVRLTAAAASCWLLVSCGGNPETEPESPAETPHGYVEGAEETAEAQSRMIVADATTGALRVVDLITEEVTELGQVDGVDGIVGDGRFGYLDTVGDFVHVTDSGSWTVDHGDHVHYYRAEPREVGTVQGKQLTGAYSDPAVAALSFSDGSVALLDQSQLGDGAIAETNRITGNPHEAVAVPYKEHILTSVAEAGQHLARGVEVRTRDGLPFANIDEPCPSLRGAAVTRRGVVFGCADGALLVTREDGAFHGEKIGYPRPVGDEERATEFTHRPLSTTLAAKAGDDGVWLLDVSRKAWNEVRTGPTIAVNAVGEGAPLLTLTDDGVLYAYDPESGEQIAKTNLLPAEVAKGTPAPVIQVDTTRAYVNNPSAGELYEIDYNDDLRRARTLAVDGRASYTVETGR